MSSSKKRCLVLLAMCACFQLSCLSSEPLCNLSVEEVPPLTPEQAQEAKENQMTSALRYFRVRDYLKARVTLVAPALLGKTSFLSNELYFKATPDLAMPEVEFGRRSGNVIFDSICREAVLSLEGNALLKFPNPAGRKDEKNHFQFTYVAPKVCPETAIELSNEELKQLMKKSKHEIKKYLDAKLKDRQEKKPKALGANVSECSKGNPPLRMRKKPKLPHID